MSDTRPTRKPTQPHARQALADAISEELSVDLTPEFMLIVDKILMRLYIYDHKVVRIKTHE